MTLHSSFPSPGGAGFSWTRLLVTLLLAALFGILQLARIWAPLDRHLADLALWTVRPSAPLPRMVLVGIDDRSLAEFGRWPWPRAVLARLLEKLSDAAAVGLDVAVVEPSPLGSRDDRRLIEAVRTHGRVVLPVMAAADVGGIGEVPPLPALAEVAAGLGHVVLRPDADGNLRSLALGAGQSEPLLPAFALALLQVAGKQALLPAGLSRRSSAAGGWKEQGKLLLPLWGVVDRPLYLSAADLLHGRYSASMLRNGIVLVGMVAEGITQTSNIPTGLGVRRIPGSQVQAGIAMALAGGLGVRPAGREIAALSAASLAALFGCLFCLGWRPLPLLGMTLLLPVVLVLSVLIEMHLWIAPSGALLSGALLVFARVAEERSRQRRLLDLERRRAGAILEAIDNAILLMGEDGTVRYANPAAGRLFGREHRSISGWRPSELFPEAGTPAHDGGEPLQAVGNPGRADHEEPRLRDMPEAADPVLLTIPAGSERARTVQMKRFRMPGDDRPGGDTLVVLTDLTESMRLHRELEWRATRDPITGLYNRQFIHEWLRQAVARARSAERDLGVLLVDLDRFKEVNDRFGHQIGDQLLRHVAWRLKAGCRSDDTVARIGGDEFLIVMEDPCDRRQAALLADELHRRFEEPMEVGGRQLPVRLSIGVTCLSDAPDHPEGMLTRADLAVHEAKRRREAVCLFSPELDMAARLEMEIREELRAAVKRGAFRLHFQPRVDLHANSVCGFEALLRWRRPTGEPVSPAVFIPIAENAGLLGPITEWVIREALLSLHEWHRSGRRDLSISVNVSAREFAETRLVRCIENALDQARVPPTALIVEITESMLMDDPHRAIRVMRELKHAGIRIAIDDFGTGYSSLAYLRDFPIDELKIDRSFAQRIGVNERDDLIVTAIVRMGQSLRLELVAEGIEEPSQARFLRRLGVRQAQGFLYSRPVDMAKAGAMLARSGIATASRAE